jgi:hypothetical protein
MNRVQFSEEQQTKPLSAPKPNTITDVLIRTGLAKTPQGAFGIMLLVAFFLAGAAVYLIASAVPPPPVLGPDVLQPGETVPAYVNH